MRDKLTIDAVVLLIALAIGAMLLPPEARGLLLFIGISVAVIELAARIHWFLYGLAALGFVAVIILAIITSRPG